MSPVNGASESHAAVCEVRQPVHVASPAHALASLQHEAVKQLRQAASLEVKPHPMLEPVLEVVGRPLDDVVPEPPVPAGLEAAQAAPRGRRRSRESQCVPRIRREMQANSRAVQTQSERGLGQLIS
jgi:hypothetical protein